jgi:hypothetical protein
VSNNPLPESAVIAAGPGAPGKDGKIVRTQVKAGDRVLLPGWGDNAIKLGDEVRSLFIFRNLQMLICFSLWFLCAARHARMCVCDVKVREPTF